MHGSHLKQKTEDPALRRRRIGTLLSLGAFVLFLALAGWFVGRPMLRFASDPERFRLWVDGRGVWGRLLFTAAMAVQVVAAVIPSEALEIGAGYAFGTWPGALLCLLGIVAGSALVVALTRRYGMRMVELFYRPEKIEKAKFWQDSGRLYLIVFLLFLIPGTPKDLFTYLIFITPIDVKRYILLTSAARFPSIVMSTFAGSTLGAEDPRLTAAVLGACLLLGVAGFFACRRVTRARERREEAPAAEPEETERDVTER